MLDFLPPAVRHAVIALIAALLSWAVQLLPSWNLPPVLSTVVATALTIALTYFTPLVGQYGVGSHAGTPADTTVDVLTPESANAEIPVDIEVQQ
jgi:hypothetical protein